MFQYAERHKSFHHITFTTWRPGKISSRVPEFVIWRVQHILKLSASLAVHNVRIHDFGLIDTHNRTNRCVFARHRLTVLVNSSWLATGETSEHSLAKFRRLTSYLRKLHQPTQELIPVFLLLQRHTQTSFHGIISLGESACQARCGGLLAIRGTTGLLLVRAKVSTTTTDWKHQALRSTCIERVNCSHVFRVECNNFPFTMKSCACVPSAFQVAIASRSVYCR
jgi:hypothetical protein